MKKIIVTMVTLLTSFVSINAMTYNQAREEALFLTDKMAYELNFNEQQYEAAYEINLDYLMSLNTEADLYADCWRQRCYDFEYILNDWQYSAFTAASYFFRPVIWRSGFWHFGVYSHYPHRDRFYFSRPACYVSYRGGGHSWRNNGGHSWYRGRISTYRPAGNHVGMRETWRGTTPGGAVRGGAVRGGVVRGVDQRRGGSYGNVRENGNFRQNNSNGGYQQNNSNGNFRQNHSNGGYQQNNSNGNFRQNNSNGGYQQNNSTGGFQPINSNRGFRQNNSNGGYQQNNSNNGARPSTSSSNYSRPSTSGSNFSGSHSSGSFNSRPSSTRATVGRNDGGAARGARGGRM